jgi:N-acetylneuraminic acid mutarotase
VFSLTASARGGEFPTWSKLPSLPDREGFAGAFAGTHGGALIVAGGANFPDKKPWEGGTKVWYDTVFVLDNLNGQWRTGGKLPRPLGYGAAVTTKDGMACIGGSDAKHHYADTFLLRYSEGKVAAQKLPSLPRSCANFSGAFLANTIYVAGGTERPDATEALKTFWSLDVSRPDAGWRELDPWPGPERMLATVGVRDGSLFLFSGAALKAGPDGKPRREWLRDAYRFTPGKGWKRIADLPRAAVAAPAPSPVVNGKLLVLGGDDGTQVNTALTEHKGFPRDVLAYDPGDDKWERFGELPFALVTTMAVVWDDRLVIPGGEARPGVRSPEVWSLDVKGMRTRE